jgi:hypothetical protein
VVSTREGDTFDADDVAAGGFRRRCGALASTVASEALAGGSADTSTRVPVTLPYVPDSGWSLGVSRWGDVRLAASDSAKSGR